MCKRKCPRCKNEIPEYDENRTGWRNKGLTKREKKKMHNNECRTFYCRECRLFSCEWCYLNIGSKWFVFRNEKWRKIQSLKISNERERVIFT